MKMIKWEYSKKLNDKGAIDKFEKKYSIEFPSYLKKMHFERNKNHQFLFSVPHKNFH